MYTQTHSDTHTHTIPSLTVHINGSELVVVLEMGTVVLKDSVLLRLFGQVRRHWESFHVQRGSLIEQKHTHTYTSPHRSLHLQRSANATVYSKVFSTDNSFNKLSPKNKQTKNNKCEAKHSHTHTHHCQRTGQVGRYPNCSRSPLMEQSGARLVKNLHHHSRTAH